MACNQVFDISEIRFNSRLVRRHMVKRCQLPAGHSGEHAAPAWAPELAPDDPHYPASSRTWGKPCTRDCDCTPDSPRCVFPRP